MTRRAAIWALAALAGFALAVGVTYAASRLSTQHVGLSSEPLTAGDALAPRQPPTPRPRPARTATPGRTATPARTATPVAPAPNGAEQDGGDGDD